jgi:hypothetical protein
VQEVQQQRLLPLELASSFARLTTFAAPPPPPPSSHADFVSVPNIHDPFGRYSCSSGATVVLTGFCESFDAEQLEIAQLLDQDSRYESSLRIKRKLLSVGKSLGVLDDKEIRVTGVDIDIVGAPPSQRLTESVKMNCLHSFVSGRVNVVVSFPDLPSAEEACLALGGMVIGGKMLCAVLIFVGGDGASGDRCRVKHNQAVLSSSSSLLPWPPSVVPLAGKTDGEEPGEKSNATASHALQMPPSLIIQARPLSKVSGEDEIGTAVCADNNSSATSKRCLCLLGAVVAHVAAAASEDVDPLSTVSRVILTRYPSEASYTSSGAFTIQSQGVGVPSGSAHNVGKVPSSVQSKYELAKVSPKMPTHAFQALTSIPVSHFAFFFSMVYDDY